MNTFKITFSDGDTITTGFNGSLLDAEKYYVGQWLNLGGVIDPTEDSMVKGIKVEVIQ